MHPYARSIRRMFEKHADPKAAAPMKRYMRGQFEYLGIKGPKMGELLKEHYAENGLPDISELDVIVCELWSLPQREFQYAATSLIGKFEKQLPEEFIETLEYLLVNKSWWDTVDTISGGILGVHFKRYPKVRRKCLMKWRKSGNFWLRRACILFQLNYKEETDFDLLCEIIRENLGSKEFFINKAIGWALRQYTCIDPQAVRQFVAETPLSPLSAREALKWLEKRKS
ncbi:MAG: DNA alkylation repair protein [Chloroflexi bacterium]|nr:DNA alkylation repair protein [Chloroflexota bacterium]